MGQPLELPVQLVEVHCGECGGTYAINARYHAQRVAKGGYWTCPYCKCGWGFKTGEEKEAEQKRQRELAEEKQRHQQTLARLNEESAARAKAEQDTKRLKARAKAGVCPCCNRSFAALNRHMKTKHPEYSS